MTNSQLHNAHVSRDTIAALATPPGVSGIAVLRISGDLAIESVARKFSGAHDLRTAATHTAHYGKLMDADGSVLDDVLATVFRAPASYTGEDSVEVSCHGGGVVVQAVLRSLLSGDVRHAEPGEFTRRAFLNGRMDLAQAEAVADLIHSQSEAAYRASRNQLEGSLSRFVDAIREQLMECAALLELHLDFAEEDIELIPPAEVRVKLMDAKAKLAEALDSYNTGRCVRDGIKVALVGKPNAGKSSLLNAVLGMNRAIVTDIPGTTRDYIEEKALIDGIMFRFVDTAGLRSGGDAIEQMGISLTHEHILTADILCVVNDAAADDMLDPADTYVVESDIPDGRRIVLANKIDLLSPEGRTALLEIPGCVPVSAVTSEGMADFFISLKEAAGEYLAPAETGSVLVTNSRHADCMRRGLDALDLALIALDDRRTEEVLAFELKHAVDALGEIIGKVTSEDVLHAIFARFCIGK